MTLALVVALLAAWWAPSLPLRTGRLHLPPWAGTLGVAAWLAGWWLVL